MASDFNLIFLSEKSQFGAIVVNWPQVEDFFVYFGIGRVYCTVGTLLCKESADVGARSCIVYIPPHENKTAGRYCRKTFSTLNFTLA
jgi:hypothetical protein